jgi:hypothetical protein
MFRRFFLQGLAALLLCLSSDAQARAAATEGTLDINGAVSVTAPAPTPAARPRPADDPRPTAQFGYTETLEQKWDGPFYLMESAYDGEKAARAVPTEGLFGHKVTDMRDNSTAFQGKFRIVRFKQENASSLKDVDYAVDHDWALPIGYTNIS